MICKIIMIILVNQQISEILNIQIQRYKNVTLRSCGLSSQSYETVNTTCFQWHKTIRQIRTEQLMANIKGGRDAEIGEFPYNVLIDREWDLPTIPWQMSSCSGAIINAQWIVTAGHCLQYDPYKSIYKIYAGFTIHPWFSSHYIPDKDVFIHPKFNVKKSEYDIGLIKLERKIDFVSDAINSVCLPNSNYEIGENDSDVFAIFCGWGDTNMNQHNHNRLKALRLRLNPKSKDSLMITSNSSADRFCYGDSGGPLVKYINGRAVLIGIAEGSGGVNVSGCVYGEIRMFFTSIPNIVSWIVSTIRNNA